MLRPAGRDGLSLSLSLTLACRHSIAINARIGWPTAH
jgi:hypothetical protein